MQPDLLASSALQVPKSESRYISLRASADGSLLRTASFNGVSHIVVPIVTAVGDNVWWPANAPTPELVPASVLAAHAFSRNNRPVVMGHPKQGGDYCSANDPKILEEYGFGTMFASSFENGRIVVEAWLDPTRAALVGPDAVSVCERLQAGEQVEVSEGDYVVTVAESGELNGKKYGARWVSAVSDHLAMLKAGDIGACNNKMGCGGPRVSVLRSSVSSVLSASSQPAMRFVAMSQAHTPTYAGTESTKWSKPSFADYIKYLDDSAEPPKTVAQCSSALKTAIVSHTLLGDTSASSFADLSLFPVVNPANGKLNERALRAVLTGRGSSTSVSEIALTSAQEIARRLLNSEFSVSAVSASISASSSEANMKTNVFKRMVAKIRSAMSNDSLQWQLYKAVSSMEPGVEYVDDEDVAAGTFRYVVMICFGDSWASNSEVQYHYYQRTFTIDADDNVTVNDDRIELVYDEQSAWRPMPVAESSTSDSTVPAMFAASASDCECPDKTDCHCNEPKGATSVKTSQMQKDLATRLIVSSASPFEESDRLTLETLPETKLQTLADTYKPAETAAVVPAASTPATTVPAVTASGAASTTTPIPASATSPAPGQRILTEDEYSTLKSAADAFQVAQQARRTHLVSALKTACGTSFSDADLNALDTSVLEKLAASHHIDAPATADFSLRGVPSSSLILSEADKMAKHAPKDTWALALAEKRHRAGVPDDKSKAN